MLKQRVITAIVLLAVLLAAVSASSPWPLMFIVVIASACGLWEWLRLVWPTQFAVRGPILVAILTGLSMAALTAQWLSLAASTFSLELFGFFTDALIPLVSLIWILGASVSVIRGNATASSSSWLLSAFALLAVIAVWFSITRLYLEHGAWFVVSLMALIWAADIAAYFCGKAFGRHKLAPRVSPGKTWEGALGGVFAAVVWVLVSAQWPGSFGAHLKAHFPLGILIPLVALLAALSIIGDLFESLLKRRAGVKDSSHLLPGHGGVFDRIDALLPVAPIALLLSGASS